MQNITRLSAISLALFAIGTSTAFSAIQSDRSGVLLATPSGPEQSIVANELVNAQSLFGVLDNNYAQGITGQLSGSANEVTVSP